MPNQEPTATSVVQVQLQSMHAVLAQRGWLCGGTDLPCEKRNCVLQGGNDCAAHALRDLHQTCITTKQQRSSPHTHRHRCRQSSQAHTHRYCQPQPPSTASVPGSQHCHSTMRTSSHHSGQTTPQPHNHTYSRKPHSQIHTHTPAASHKHQTDRTRPRSSIHSKLQPG